MSDAPRGSRKHVLDWVTHPDFHGQLNDMLAGTGARIVQATHQWMPTATNKAEARLDTTGRHLLPEPALVEKLLEWWLVERRSANTPNWDLAANCSLGDKQGLVLVEAKAHEDEMDWGPKPLAVSASVGTKANHRRIGAAIEEARLALDHILPGPVAISRDAHYQLSNRVAYAWKLASLGVPVVLVYLGFLGDAYFRNDYLRDADHWQRVMGGYMRGVLPLSMVGEPVLCGSASFTLLIRSRVVDTSADPTILRRSGANG